MSLTLSSGGIHVFFPDGTFFQTWRSPAQRHFSGAMGISTDEEGTLYVPDPTNSRVLKFNNRGRLLKSWPAPQKAAIAGRAALVGFRGTG